jgi:hypothetical protein
VRRGLFRLSADGPKNSQTVFKGEGFRPEAENGGRHARAPGRHESAVLPWRLRGRGVRRLTTAATGPEGTSALPERMMTHLPEVGLGEQKRPD